MSRHTGRMIDGDAHLAQSITDILSTPLGTRVMRRDYGSSLPELIDAPMNGETVVDVFAATAEALDRWEPRFRLSRVQVSAASAGDFELDLEGQFDGATRALTVRIGVPA
ncbi:GPW/gp25 family protein [Paracoccus haematequi]|nr:GPW/gp25 family protein [Paracoccus haematequi]